MTPLLPCSNCAGLIIQSNIGHVVASMPEDIERWRDSFELTKTMFEEAYVNLVIA